MATPTYVALATTTLSGTTASVTFSSIPATYRDLVIIGNFDGNNSNAVLEITFNGVTTNQSGVRMYGIGSGSGSSDTTASDAIQGAVGLTRANAIVQIFDYSATDKHKTVLMRSDQADRITLASAGRWAQTTAINSVGLTTNSLFNAGSTFSLYGIEA